MRYLVLTFCFLFFFQVIVSATILSTRADDVKLYRDPDIYSDILFDYQKDFPLKVIGRAGDWYKVVDWMRLSGWVLKSQLKNETSCVVFRSRINFRSGPGRRYSKIGRLFQGNVLRLLKTTRYWAKVKVIDPNTGQVGWVHRRLLWGI